MFICCLFSFSFLFGGGGGGGGGGGILYCFRFCCCEVVELDLFVHFRNMFSLIYDCKIVTH